jgi:PIN domain nuclease of toxin-antitoxin system
MSRRSGVYASAIIAASNNEAGSRIVLALKDQSAVSTVNLAEVQSKLVQRGLAPGDAWAAALTFSAEIFSFDSEQAEHRRRSGGVYSSVKAIAG